MTELLTLLATDPAHAQRVAHALVTAPDPATRVTALRVLALATRELGHLPSQPPTGAAIGTLADAEAMLREALATAERAGLEYAAAQVRTSLVSLLAEQGETRQALAAAEAVLPSLEGTDAARLTANRICALARGGRLVEARELALAVRRDPAAPPGLLMNAGLALATSGAAEAAELCLTEAVVRADRAGHRHERAMARANLAYAAARRGDLARALRLYAQAEPDLTGTRAAQTRLDRAETLVIAGLPGPARPLIESALEELARSGCSGDVADALLLLARTELADADPEQAVETAERARAAYAAQDRAGWALIAEHLLLQARWAAGDRSAVFLRSAVAIAERLAAGGWTGEAADGHLIAARLALHLDRPAGALLAAAAAARHRGPAALRAAAWHATALARDLAGDRRGALAAVRAGLRVIGDHAAALGALELRVHATRLGDDLAHLGLTLATTPATLLILEESRRAICWPALVHSEPTAGGDRPPAAPPAAADQTSASSPGGPPPDDHCDRLLADLRQVAADREAAAAGGGDTRALAGRQAQLEAALRTRTLMASGSGRVRRRDVVGAVAEALGERAFVELIRIGEELHAVTLVSGRLRRWALGSSAAAAHESTLLRFALRRHVCQNEPGGGGARDWAVHAERLGRQVFGPMRRVLGDREVVLAPVGALHGMAWTALPEVGGRAVSVVPSAAAWLTAHARTSAIAGLGGPAGGRVVLVAGPGLAHAAAEVAAVGRLYPGATVRDGAAARVQDVRQDLDGAALAHLAAHGRFRAEDALLSGVRLADGPLLAHDIGCLRRPPHTVVLSACEAGRADDAEGALGMAGALLAAGTATVIAGITPVRDAATRDFMVALHRRLATGERPAQALAALPRTPDLLGFQCFGAG